MNWFVSHQCHYKDNFDGEHAARVTRQIERERDRERARESLRLVCCVVQCNYGGVF